MNNSAPVLSTSSTNYGLIQIETIDTTNIAQIVALVEKELFKRNQLYFRYKRKVRNSDFIALDDKNIKVPFEKYIADMAVGYFAGKKPSYTVNKDVNEQQQDIIENNLKMDFNTPEELAEMEVYLNKLTTFNEDQREFYNLAKDYLIKSACYEYVYENEDNQIVYTYLDALQTCAIWDFSLPKKVSAIVRIWWDIIQGIQFVEVTNSEGKSIYEYNSKEQDGRKKKEYKLTSFTPDTGLWDGLQIIAIENPEGTAIFEGVISLIEAYERVMRNTKNTFQYNDDAILTIRGYNPQNSATIEQTVTNQDGTTEVITVANPARTAEDAMIKTSGMMYLEGDGEAKWVEKDVHDGALQNYRKTLIDLITMISTVPNTTDLGFSSADNASALTHKYFALQQSLEQMDKQFEKGLHQRWKLIFNHINKKSLGTKKYDSTNISINFYRNLPTDKKAETDRILQLRGLLSDETAIKMLPDELDAIVELEKREREGEDDLIENIERVKDLNRDFPNATIKEVEDVKSGDIKPEIQENRPTTETMVTRLQENLSQDQG